MTIDTGGPMFPHDEVKGVNMIVRQAHEGITYRQWLVGMAMYADFTNPDSKFYVPARVWCQVADAAIKAERETRDATGKESLPVPDLDHCPSCGGPADNGHDRLVPPNPYPCSKCDPI